MSKTKTRKKSKPAVRVNKGRKATAGLARLLEDQKPKTATVVFDWKDSPDTVLSDLVDTLKDFGIHLYASPYADGGDNVIFHIANKKLNKAQIADLDEELFS